MRKITVFGKGFMRKAVVLNHVAPKHDADKDKKADKKENKKIK